MTRPPLVVIGASAGGVEALKRLVRDLPPGYPASICVVLHLAADLPSYLPQILSRAGPLPARHPGPNEVLRPGHIYLAPPDHHLMVEGERVEATKGPRENRFRPSIDALFRSAAYSHGANVIGVVLSGLLDDGTSGLWTVGRRGGVTVVQSPEDAEFDSMPRSALEHVRADHIVPLRELAALLTRLVGKGARQEGREEMDDEELRRLRIEVEVARDEQAYQRGILDLGELASMSCPDCHGALVQLREGDVLRFRCHTGHALTADALLSDMTKNSEQQAYQLLRSLEETQILLRRLARHRREQGDFLGAGVLLEQAEALDDRVTQTRELALRNRRMSEQGVLGRGQAAKPEGEG